MGGVRAGQGCLIEVVSPLRPQGTMDLLGERTQHPAWGAVGAWAQWVIYGTPRAEACGIRRHLDLIWKARLGSGRVFSGRRHRGEEI